MAATTMSACPVVGSTLRTLPPSHPPFDLDKPGQICPITKATSDSHPDLLQHPRIPGISGGAESCPALQKVISRPEQQAMDEGICPVIGEATQTLPPDHPSMDNAKEGDICPKTNASFRSHSDKVHAHPSVENAPKGAVCPVVGIGKS